MRTRVNSSSPWILVGTQSTTGPSWYSTNTTDAATYPGAIRYNASTHSYEIWTGSYWTLAPTDSVTVGLDSETERVLAWAQQRMQEDQAREQRMQDNPALRAAWEQYEIVDALTKKDIAPKT